MRRNSVALHKMIFTAPPTEYWLTMFSLALLPQGRGYFVKSRNCLVLTTSCRLVILSGHLITKTDGLFSIQNTAEAVTAFKKYLRRHFSRIGVRHSSPCSRARNWCKAISFSVRLCVKRTFGSSIGSVVNLNVPQ